MGGDIMARGGGFDLYYQFKVGDENGKIVKKTRKCKGYSYLKAFIQMMQWYSGNYPGTTVRVIGGGTRTTVLMGSYQTSETTSGFIMDGSVGQTRGPVIGTGDTPVNVSDYRLTLIGNGTGTGQLQYGAVVFGTPTIDTSTIYTTLTRVWTNGSGGDVTIKEIGLYSYSKISENHATYLITRDVLPSPITLTNGQTLTLDYTLKANL
jgi:hypothetical protein